MPGARCLLIPSLVPETSSLVAMEAASCGTPVIAFPSGALTEVVSDGATGRVVQDTAEMAEAIRTVDSIPTAGCGVTRNSTLMGSERALMYVRTYIELTRKVRAFYPEWLDLYQRCPDASPFLHPAWQTAWWETFGTCPLHLIEYRRGGSLEALAVCYKYDDRLVFVGNGFSDRLGILCGRPGCR